MANTFTDNAYTQVALEKALIYARTNMSLPGVDHKIEQVEMGLCVHYLCIQLRAAVWAQRPQQVSAECVPATWWDHFKLTYFPEWLIDRFPANKRHVYIDVKVLYPQLKVEVPNSQPCLHLVFEDGSWPLEMESE